MNKHLCWVPHRLDDVAMRARLTLTESRLKNFRQAQRQDWQYLLTSDELRFFHATVYE
jgi:hypothetical protein